MDNSEILKKLKVLNSMIEDFLDKMDIEAADEESEESTSTEKED